MDNLFGIKLSNYRAFTGANPSRKPFHVIGNRIPVYTGMIEKIELPKA